MTRSSCSAVVNRLPGTTRSPGRLRGVTLRNRCVVGPVLAVTHVVLEQHFQHPLAVPHHNLPVPVVRPSAAIIASKHAAPRTGTGRDRGCGWDPSAAADRGPQSPSGHWGSCMHVRRMRAPCTALGHAADDLVRARVAAAVDRHQPGILQLVPRQRVALQTARRSYAARLQ